MPPLQKGSVSNLDSNQKENNLSHLTVNTYSITGKIADLVTNLNLVIKRVSFIKATKTWLSYDSKLVLETNGYKSHELSEQVENTEAANYSL